MEEGTNNQLQSQAKPALATLSDISDKLNSGPVDNGVLTLTGFNPFEDGMSFPIRVDALAIILVDSGEAVVRIDLRNYKLHPGSLMIIQSRNYINVITDRSEAGTSCRASVLLCSQHLLENILPKLTDMLPLILGHRKDPVTQLDQEEYESLSDFFMFIHKNRQREASPLRHKKILALLQAAIFELLDIFMRNNPGTEVKQSRKEEIMARFLILVSKHFREKRQVGYYADELCITAKHLSAVVKSASGRTAGDWIDHYVIMEAKVLLRTTDLSIQEIASSLNFNNQSFFGKYFRQLTGESPTSYRRSTQA